MAWAFHPSKRVCALGLVALACGDAARSDDDAASSLGGSGESTSADPSGTSEGSIDGSSSAPTTSASDASDDAPIFDVARPETGGTTGEPIDICKVGDDGSGTGPCRMQAPADSFAPMLQWSWAGEGAFAHSIVTPLVANMTDDNADGAIDLCDTPDVLVTVNTGSCTDAHLFLLDGENGTVHYELDSPVARASTPAIGDIDGDGLPEIVAQTGSSNACSGTSVSAWEHDGTPIWTTVVPGLGGEHAIALADIDTDDDVEILIDRFVLDHTGVVVQNFADTGGAAFYWTSTAAADLDDDGDLEVVLGRSAWHHDGSALFSNGAIEPGHPAIGDIDADGLPEIILIQSFGFSILQDDGIVTTGPINPTGDPDWRRPATIHDLDGDNVSEFAASSSNRYTSFEGDASVNWSMPVADSSGLASGTAFDFLGDGVAEAIYADETQLWVFDGLSGDVQLQAPRASITIIEYPVVVDVDNDGSSEILVVSNHGADPVLQVYRDAEDRWIQARRIWNQHTYHVTNVREDATIPQFETPHWQQLNTFRTNAQIEGGSVCRPEG